MLTTLVLLSLFAAPLSEGVPAERQLTPKQAARDLKVLKLTFEKLHPGLFRYQTPAQFEAAFAEAAKQVEQGLSLRRFYALVARLAADVRCGHTWLNPANQPDSVKAELYATPRLLPALLDFVEGRFLVMASMDPALQVGDEVLALGDVSMAKAVELLQPMLRSDGGNLAKRAVQLSHRTEDSALDDLLPLVVGDPPGGKYRVRLARPGADGGAAEREVTVAAVTLEARRARFPAAPRLPAWSFRIEGKRAYWKMPSFAYFDDEPRAKLLAEFDANLQALAAQKVEGLVIDLRENEGGSDVVMDHVLQGLLRKPFVERTHHGESSYERAPYALVKFLDTWDFGFFDRTGDVVKGKGRNLLIKSSASKEQRYTPLKNAFTGKVAVLVGPENSSATFLLALRLQRAKAATLVGEPTGGNQRGLNGGELTWVTLPSSAVTVDVPLIAWVGDGREPDQGAIPDVAAPRTVEDVRAGRDAALLAARKLLP